jgi:hypothetical protein
VGSVTVPERIMTRWVVGFAVVAVASIAASVLSACGGGGGGGGSTAVTGFVTADTRGGGAIAGGATGAGGIETGAPAPPTLEAPGPNIAGSAGDVAREIADADVYAVEGDRLVLLNVHRGLAVVDLSGPTILGRLALSGAPRDLFVAGGIAFAVLADFDGGTTVVDVSLASPATPTQRARRDLAGYPVASRRIGNALYVVTTSDVRSFSTDGLLTPLGTAPLPDGATFVHATSTLFAVAGWGNGLATPVTLVDVSSPTGAIASRGSIDLAGWISDEKKLDIAGTVLRVVTHDWINGGLSRLFTVNVANPDAPAILGTLSLARGEQLFATRFDGNRAYIVTFERVDPLWVIDLSNPAAPKIAGSLIVPGWSTDIVPVGNRLVALGVETSPTWHLVASLFDVSNPALPALLDRADLPDGWSEAFGDVRAFGVFPADGLVTVPISGASDGGSRVAVLALGATTLTLRGSIDLSGQALRGFPHPRGLIAMSTEEVVVANATTLAALGRVTIADNVVDVVRTADGTVRPLLARGSLNGRLDGVDLPLTPDRAFASGYAVAVVGWDAKGRAAYVVDFSGPAPVVSTRFALGEAWFALGAPAAGLAFPCPGGGWLASEIAMTPAGRLVVHGAAIAGPSGPILPGGPMIPGPIGTTSDGFVVIDVPNSTLDAPVTVASGFVTGFAMDGETLAYTTADPVAADGLGRPRLRHDLVRVDLSTHTTSPSANVPGYVLALDGNLAFTAEETWDAGWTWTCAVVTSLLPVAGGEATDVDRLPLPDGSYDLRAAGHTLFFSTSNGWDFGGGLLSPVGIGGGGGAPMPLAGNPATSSGAATGVGFSAVGGGFAPWFSTSIGTMRLGMTLAFGPSIQSTDNFRTLLLPEDGSALVVRDGVHVERWDVSGTVNPVASMTWDTDVAGWPLAAHADTSYGAPGDYLAALGYGGWLRLP